MTVVNPASARLRSRDGQVLPSCGQRWIGSPTPADRRVLARVDGPVLDVGCGPGRLLLALCERGIVSLGIDVSPHALELARRRGAPVLHRSIFQRVPGAGRWGTALMLDGNVGIGGDPVVLLTRVMTLMRRGGRLLVEVDPAGAPRRTRVVRLEIDGVAGPWFPWAHVGVDHLPTLVERCGTRLRDVWDDTGRWFAHIER